jgi:hypothetical protein
MRKRGPIAPSGPRGTGRARRDRRVMRRGGEGVAADLNRVVGTWLGVRITPMFGRFGYFVGERLFACYPIHPRDHGLWVRLSRPDQVRALVMPGVRPHRRFGTRGWIEYDVADPEVVSRALRWLRRGYEFATRSTPDDPP